MSNNNLYNPIERIFTYASYLSLEEGITLKELSRQSGIPISVVRSDFASLSSSGFDMYCTSDEDLYCTSDEEDCSKAEAFSEGLLDNVLLASGEYDDVSDYDDSISVPVSVMTVSPSPCQ